MKLPVIIEDSAKNELIRLLEIKGLAQNVGVRIAIRGSGCSGTSFVIGFDEPQTDDHIFEEDNFKIYIQKKHFLYLTGVKIKFHESSEQRGFVFE